MTRNTENVSILGDFLFFIATGNKIIANLLIKIQVIPKGNTFAFFYRILYRKYQVYFYNNCFLINDYSIISIPK